MNISEIIDRIDALEDQMSTGPFVADRFENIGGNMLIAAFGDDNDGVAHVVRTDNVRAHVRASDCQCDPEADAAFFALVRNHWPEISKAWKERL